MASVYDDVIKNTYKLTGPARTADAKATDFKAYEGISAPDIAKENQASMTGGVNDRYEGQKSEYNDIIEQYVNGIGAYYDTAGGQVKTQANKRLEELPQSYHAAYDQNTVQQMVNRRQVAERMADMGLSDSGLNRTQQTAVNMMRMNAGSATRLQQPDAERDEKIGQNMPDEASKVNDIRFRNSRKLQGSYNTMRQSMDSRRAQNQEILAFMLQEALTNQNFKKGQEFQREQLNSIQEGY